VEGGADVVAHVDAKVDPKPFCAGAPSEVRFVADRVGVQWGGWSLVAATLRSLRDGLADFPTATHFSLISGDSYPLRPVPTISAYLDEQPGVNFLSAVTMPSTREGKPLTRLSHHWIEHDPRTDRFAHALNAWYRIARRPYRRSLGGMRPYGGSSWFTITRDSAEYVLGHSDPRDPFVRLCTSSLCPDEHFIHTILMNSEHAERVKANLMYADFSGGWDSPPALTAEHIRTLAQLPGSTRDTYSFGRQTLAFARKFGDASPEIVDLVEETCWPLPLGE
jgi:hypothetical protein